MNNTYIIKKRSKLYPQKLNRLKIPPEVLFAVGNIKLLNSFCIGVVGARACTSESIELTKQLVNELCKRNITILSGMADGVDQVAHEACIKVGGKTIAIIGCGFNHIRNKSIFSKILNNDGLIISEYFPDIPAFSYNFPRRNQILVALSKGIVAVETHMKSGTMITSREALKQKIPLFTFPGGIYDSKYAGNNWLLTEGARCINSETDLIENLIKIYPSQGLKTIIHKSQLIVNIPKEYQLIYSTLTKMPQNINSIATKLNISLNELQSKLFMMELDGLIIKESPNNYRKI